MHLERLGGPCWKLSLCCLKRFSPIDKLCLVSLCRSFLGGWIWEGQEVCSAESRPVLQPWGDVSCNGPGQDCEVLGIHSSWKRAWVFYNWLWEIFQVFAYGFLWAARDAERINHVCQHCYCSAECFPILSSAVRKEAEVKTQLQIMWN